MWGLGVQFGLGYPWKTQLVAVEPMLSWSAAGLVESLQLPPSILVLIYDCAQILSSLYCFQNAWGLLYASSHRDCWAWRLPCPLLTSQQYFMCFTFWSILSCTRSEMLQRGTGHFTFLIVPLLLRFWTGISAGLTKSSNCSLCNALLEELWLNRKQGWAH